MPSGFIGQEADSPLSLRWIAVTIFILSSTLNYLDRNLLATLAPLIIAEFQLNQTGFGFLVSAFSVSYAASSLLVGWFLDRVGVNKGITIAVAWWSASAASCGFAASFSSLTACRIALGIGEAAGVPAVGKVNGVYLKPSERALGAALNQVGLSLGSILLPLWIVVASLYSWRTPFIVVGALGFVWIPLWQVTRRFIRPTFPESGPPLLPARSVENQAGFRLLLDSKLLALVLANVLWMGAYSLWTNWTTLYLIKVHGLTLQQSAAYIWIPPLISNAGGFFGGWLSQRSMNRGVEAVSARCGAVWWSAVGMLVTLLLPFAPNAGWATVIIAASFFFALAGSVNIYAIPIDLYGPARSGLAIAALVFAFGVLQTVISPIIGYMSDHKLYNGIVWIVALPPLLSALVLQIILSRRSQAQTLETEPRA